MQTIDFAFLTPLEYVQYEMRRKRKRASCGAFLEPSGFKQKRERMAHALPQILQPLKRQIYDLYRERGHRVIPMVAGNGNG